jgi:hypothetical protein
VVRLWHLEWQSLSDLRRERAERAMIRAEQEVKLAADLYEARRAARFLLGASYVEALKPYRDFIGRVMVSESLPVLRAALKIEQSIPPADPIPLMCVLAAAVEMMEEPASSVSPRDQE